MTVQLAFPFTPTVDDRWPTFLAEDNATLLSIASQERRRPRGRAQAAHVLRWRAATSFKGGRMGRPTSRQLAALADLDLPPYTAEA